MQVNRSPPSPYRLEGVTALGNQNGGTSRKSGLAYWSRLKQSWLFGAGALQGSFRQETPESIKRAPCNTWLPGDGFRFGFVSYHQSSSVKRLRHFSGSRCPGRQHRHTRVEGTFLRRHELQSNRRRIRQLLGNRYARTDQRGRIFVVENPMGGWPIRLVSGSGKWHMLASALHRLTY